MLYDEQDLLRSFERIEVIDYHQELEVEGIRFTAYVAGHVLGAAMFLVEVAGVKVRVGEFRVFFSSFYYFIFPSVVFV